MKRFEFKQNNIKRGLPIAIIYLLVCFISFYLYFGGINNMADAVNSIGSAKGAGLIVGFLTIVPFILLLTLFMHKLTVELDDEKITISKKNKEIKIIPYKDIEKLQLNINSINRLEIIDNQNNVIFYFHPQQNGEILEAIILELNKHINFTKHIGEKKIIGGTIQTSVYLKNKQ